MIEDTDIRYFQGHDWTHLEFVKGLNVIMGSSDQGKSSLIRALRWLFVNKPTGNEFRSHFAERKQNTKVSSVINGKKISKKRKGTSNIYDIEGTKDSIKAVRTGVPDEIIEVTRIDDTNFHGQFDGFFLIDDSPGQRMRYFNDLLGLNIIPIAMKFLRSKHNKGRITAGELQKQGEEIEMRLLKYEDLDEIVSNLEELDSSIEMQEKTRKEGTEIKAILSSINEIEDKKEGLNLFIGEGEKIEALSKSINKAAGAEIEIENITSEIEIISSAKKASKDLGRLIEDYPKVHALLEKIGKLNDASNYVSQLEKLYSAIRQTEKAREIKGDRVLEAEKAYSNALSSLDLCPFCFSDKKHWRKTT